MERATPTWVWAVLLALALGALQARRPRPVGAEVRARLAEFVPERDPRRMSARELRQLPGVGETLALALARARDAHAGPAPLAWEDVQGIGEVRAREIRAWFRARGIEPDPLAPGDAVRGYAAGVGSSDFEWVPRLAFACFATALGCGGVPGGQSEPSAQRAPQEPGGAAPGIADADQALRTRTLALAGGALHALEAGPEDGPPVLLLHGARYTARTWAELGTLALLARAGYRAVALDWPGYGASPDWGTEDERTLLAGVCAALGGRVALVGPSLGGHFALEFLEAAPAPVWAFVGLAPAGAADFAPAAWSTPTLLVWGASDEVVPPEAGRALAERLRARFELLPDAAHPCYLDQPVLFHALLLEFLAGFRAEVAPR